MAKKLKEEDFGHGAPIQWDITHKTKRLVRSNIPKAGEPFDWSKGVTGRKIYPIKNQYKSSSCWGQAFSRFIEIVTGEDVSAKSAYAPVAFTGGGVWLRDGERLAKDIGLTTEKKVPSYLNGDAPEYFMTETSWRDKEMIADCAKRAGYEIKNIEITPDAIAEAIRDHKAVMFIFYGKNNGTWTQARPKPPLDNKDLWAHYVVSDSNVPKLRNGKKEIKFYQSWGTNVGEKGFQYFTEEYINSGYIADCFTFIKKEKPVYASDDPVWWANFLNLLKWLRANQ